MAKVTDDQAEIQRSMGRIEGTQAQIIAKLDAMIISHITHEDDDRRNFTALRTMFDNRLSEQNTLRESHLGAQDVKLDLLKQDQDRARGAGWMILGLLGALATFVGGAVIAATGGHIRFY